MHLEQIHIPLDGFNCGFAVQVAFNGQAIFAQQMAAILNYQGQDAARPQPVTPLRRDQQTPAVFRGECLGRVQQIVPRPVRIRVFQPGRIEVILVVEEHQRAVVLRQEVGHPANLAKGGHAGEEHVHAELRIGLDEGIERLHHALSSKPAHIPITNLEDVGGRAGGNLGQQFGTVFLRNRLQLDVNVRILRFKRRDTVGERLEGVAAVPRGHPDRARSLGVHRRNAEDYDVRHQTQESQGGRQDEKQLLLGCHWRIS